MELRKSEGAYFNPLTEKDLEKTCSAMELRMQCSHDLRTLYWPTSVFRWFSVLKIQTMLAWLWQSYQLT